MNSHRRSQRTQRAAKEFNAFSVFSVSLLCGIVYAPDKCYVKFTISKRACYIGFYFLTYFSSAQTNIIERY